MGLYHTLDELLKSRSLHFSLNIALCVVCIVLGLVIWTKNEQRPPVVVCHNDNSVELVAHKDFEPNIENVKRVVDILNNGIISYSFVNWEKMMEEKKAYVESKLWAEDFKYRREKADKLKRDEIHQMFYPKEHHFLTKKAPFVVDVIGELAIYSNFQSKSLPCAFRLRFEKIMPTEKNPYGLLLTKKDMVVKKKQEREGKDESFM